eukprot:COSAG04_NODE_187_length_21001_cov_8.855277_2_plen_201_part_00
MKCAAPPMGLLRALSSRRARNTMGPLRGPKASAGRGCASRAGFGRGMHVLGRYLMACLNQSKRRSGTKVKQEDPEDPNKRRPKKPSRRLTEQELSTREELVKEMEANGLTEEEQEKLASRRTPAPPQATCPAAATRRARARPTAAGTAPHPRLVSCVAPPRARKNVSAFASPMGRNRRLEIFWRILEFGFAMGKPRCFCA